MLSYFLLILRKISTPLFNRGKGCHATEASRYSGVYSGSGALASERPQPGPEDSGGGGQRLAIHMQNCTRGVGPIIMQKVERFPLLRHGEKGQAYVMILLKMSDLKRTGSPDQNLI